MSVPHETKLSGEAAMVNLGNIDEKYILSPNWKNLFNSRDIKKK